MARPSVDGVRSKSFVSPSPSLIPSLETISPLPITHLNNITTYLAGWRTDRRHDRRPQPPTPTRMATKSRSTSTAIPGPASGTSRRLTSMQKTNKSCLIPLLSPEKARRPSQRRSIGTKTDFPLSSYHLPRSLLPRSEYLLTDFEKDQHFERVFTSPEIPRSKLPGLPKSQTTPAILSPNRDIASHSLLKPVGPPLPRSNTYNDISSAQTHPNSPRKSHSNTAKVCFDDLKMSKGLKGLNVQNSRIKSPYPQISNSPLPHMSSLRIRTPSLPQFTTDGSVPSVVEVHSVSNLESDPRFVYTYELSSYWTGRYVALLDRLRTRRFLSPPSSKNVFARGNTARRKASKPKENVEYARIEINIEKEAMKILRSFCQTRAATESFEHFEFLIRREHIESIRRSEVTQPGGAPGTDSKERKVFNSQSVAIPDDSKNDRWMLSGTLPQRIFRKASSTIQQPKLEKSMTTGNFCNPHIYIASNSSSEGFGEEHGSLQHSSSAVTLESSAGCRSMTQAMPKSNDRSPRMPLYTPSNDRLNINFSRNFSHRDMKQTAVHVHGAPSQDPELTLSSEETTSSVSKSTPVDSSRRFKKSDSIKQLVDYSIREMKKMGKRRATSGTADEADGTLELR